MSKGGKVKGAGADVADPTRASKPAAPTYRYPLEKGLGVLRPKASPDNPGVPLTGYGRGGAVPSSVSVRDSVAMSDLDIAPPGGDPVLASLQSGGFGDRSESGAPIDDLKRKINTALQPQTFGMKDPNADQRKVPDTLVGDDNAQPARKPT
jgi:hypothetical protein